MTTKESVRYVGTFLFIIGTGLLCWALWLVSRPLGLAALGLALMFFGIIFAADTEKKRTEATADKAIARRYGRDTH